MHHRRVPRLVEPFLPYLLQRWADGCRNGRQLTREIEQLGYLGKGSSVRWMIARWRLPKTPRQPRRRLLTRHVPWLLLRAPDLLKDEERVDLERVLAADELLSAGYELVQRFRVALHDLDETAFKQWLIDAAGSELKPFARLAAGMTDDLEAITNALSLPVEHRARGRAHQQSQADQESRIWAGQVAPSACSHTRSELSSCRQARAGPARYVFTGYAGEPHSLRDA